MVNRLSPREAMYYFLDPSGATNHLGALLVFGGAKKRAPHAGAATTTARAAGRKTSKATKTHPAPDFDYPALVALVENRLQRSPRHRQIVREVTLGLARPVWADDPDFDIGFHIRRSGLPRPGSMADLAELVSRVMSRPLDRSRPLWEMYLIEGLAEGGFAVLTKTHRCLIDRSPGIELSEVICDDTASVTCYQPDLWMPGHPPGAASLAIGALAEAVSRPGELIDAVATGNGLISGLRSVIDAGVRQVGGVIRQVTDSAPASPLNSAGSSSQMFATAGVPRRACAEIAHAHGCTVDDVILAIISGVMRRWLLSFDVAAAITDTVRVEIPLAARDPGVRPEPKEPGWVDVGAATFVTDLPVGEDNPTVRLAQVAGLAARYANTSSRVRLGAQPVLGDLGVAPFPELGSWLFRSWGNRGYNVPVAIADAPITDRYVLGRKVTALYSVPGLVAGHALAIGVLEYRGALSFSFTADRGVIIDLPSLADYVTESFEELLEQV